MKLNVLQKKAAYNKKLGFSLIKGSKNTGKTTTAIYRSLYLKNNYCLFEEDKVLIVTADKKEAEQVNSSLLKENIRNSFQYVSLFSTQENNICVSSIQSLIKDYFYLYKERNKLNFLDITEDKKRSIIKNCVKEVKPFYRNLKIFSKDISFFEEEIDWIKGERIDNLNFYQISSRKGRRLYKNSKGREALFKVFLAYERVLKNENLIDKQDKLNIVIDELKQNRDKFTHIVIDDSHKLTKLEIEFIKGLINKNTYWSLTFILDRDFKIKFKNFGINMKGRSHLLKKQFNLESFNKKNQYTLETFQYIDLKHKRRYSFMLDEYNKEKMIVKDEEYKYEYKNEELKLIPVYNNIAAGEPILIDPQMEDSFSLPKYWIKNTEKCFMLKVKGDSMINVDIEDGDYVVIKKQYTAENRDIVAVDIDGSATLKRFKIGNGEILLIPENEKYEPIKVRDEGVSIIGIAVGILKSK